MSPEDAGRSGGMIRTTITWSELEAQALACWAGRAGVIIPNAHLLQSTNAPPHLTHELANWFIGLAERIKAERAVVAMERRDDTVDMADTDSIHEFRTGHGADGDAGGCQKA